MNLKNIITSFFTYIPQEEYTFDITENVDILPSNSDNTQKHPINSSIEQNLIYIKTIYNTLINSDVLIRPFILSTNKQKYKAFLVYIDGMIDTTIMNNFILQPLMNRKNLVNKTLITKNNIRIKKSVIFNLADYLQNCLIPQNSIKRKNNFEEIILGINSGSCALFVDTLNIAFDIEAKGFKQRSINSPNNEVVIKGSQEAFVENIRTNTSIIRRIINNENLIIENIDIGDITKTKCGVCYMKNIANSNLIAEVKYRLNNLAIDSLTSSRRT